MLTRAGEAAAAALQHMSDTQPLRDETALNSYTNQYVTSLEEIAPDPNHPLCSAVSALVVG